MAESRPSPARPEYLRVLSLGDATLLVVGCIIGAGIFFNPGRVAETAGTPGWILAAWGLGGLVALTGSLSYAELAGLYPRTGGVYVFLREAFGGLPAFLFGWAILLIIAPGALAVVADFFAANLVVFLPELGAAGQRAVACGVIALLTGLNVVGVKSGARVQNVFTIGKLAALALLIFAGLTYTGEPLPPEGGAVLSASGGGGLAGLAAAIAPVLFTYGGWQNATFVAGEVVEPRRNVPRAMLLGTAVVIAVYVLVNAGFLRILEPGAIAGSKLFAARAAEAALGPMGGKVVAAGILASTFGICAGVLLANPRLAQAVAADGLLLRPLAALHPRFRTPHRAILALGGWAIALLFLADPGQLVDSVVFADWMFFSLCGLALFVFRRRMPDAPRPYRCPLYPWVPLAFVVLAVAATGAALATADTRSRLLGAGLLAAGVPVWWLQSRRRAGATE